MPQMDLNKVIEILNEFVKLDCDAMKKLIEARVPCNDELKHHETIQVLCDKLGNNPEIGLLGVLNGLIGIHDNGWGYLSAQFETDINGDKLVGFVRSPKTKEE